MIFYGWVLPHGNKACISKVVRICSRYDNINILEEGYGINIRPLATFAMETYKDDKCSKFMPKVYDYNKYIRSDEKTMAKIHKTISMIQFKLEGQLVLQHPEYEMDDRLLLDKINYETGIIKLNGKEYEMNDRNFPTIDTKDPYKLSLEEKEIIDRLTESFLNSEKLQQHINFLYTKGSLYKRYNSNLLFHGCIPMNEEGEFETISMLGEPLSGKAFLDDINDKVNKAYFSNEKTEENRNIADFMWYLSCGSKSPLFGKHIEATFERYFLDEKETHKERKNPYFKLIEDEKVCNKIFQEFGLDPDESHIINGHIPVKEKDGESPVKANGKLLVIDRRLCKKL